MIHVQEFDTDVMQLSFCGLMHTQDIDHIIDTLQAKQPRIIINDIANMILIDNIQLTSQLLSERFLRLLRQDRLKAMIIIIDEDHPLHDAIIADYEAIGFAHKLYIHPSCERVFNHLQSLVKNLIAS